MWPEVKNAGGKIKKSASRGECSIKIMTFIMWISFAVRLMFVIPGD